MRDGLEQGFGVGVEGLLVEVVGRADFAHLAQIHHAHSVADVLDNGEVVGDEDQGEAVAGFHVFQQVEYLRLDGDIQSRDRFVADDDLRV